jgi:hypothetical protein
MAFPSSVGVPYILANAWDSARKFAGQLKIAATNVRALSLAGPVTSSDILNLQILMADIKAQLAILAAVPGLAAYAQAQTNNPSLDVAAAFSAMATAIDNCGSWVVTNFPKDGSGFLLAQTFSGAGRPTDRTFSTATLAGFRTQLDALIATID